jgi:uncharacterized membrane protein
VWNAPLWFDRVIAGAVIFMIILWLFRSQYRKWKQRRKLTQFEQEQRRKWEQHRRA